jgi:hypothetical protein
MPNDHSHQDEAVFRAATSVAPGPADLDPVARRLRTMRDELCRPPDPTARWNHVAAMRRAARPRRRGPGTVLAIAVATVGIVGTTTGLAAAGHLPGPAQEQAANLAEIVGIDLPGGGAASSPRSSNSGDDATSPPRAVPTVRTSDRTSLPVATQRPGAGGTPPGRSVPAPGTTAPGRRLGAPGLPDPPGHTDAPAASAPETSPGNRGAAPGPVGTAPGWSSAPPGHDPDGSGSSELAPGHGATPPGRDGTPPGRSRQASGHVPSRPGRSEQAPGQAKRASETLVETLDEAPEENSG